MQFFAKTISVFMFGTKLAQCADSKVVDLGGQLYFPEDAVNWNCLRVNTEPLSCVWKGGGEYFDFCHQGKQIARIAWRYSQPKESLNYLKRYVSFDHRATTLKRSRHLPKWLPV